MPLFDGVSPNLSNQVKYWGLIFDIKPTWNPNIAEATKKALVALYCSRYIVGTHWNLSPFTTLWIYTAIVKPILF